METNFNSGLHFLEEAGSKYEDTVHYLAVWWLGKSAVLNKLLHFWIGTDILMTEKTKTVYTTVMWWEMGHDSHIYCGKSNNHKKLSTKLHRAGKLLCDIIGVWRPLTWKEYGLLFRLHFIASRKYRNYF
jgi:hypothetical protein